MSHLLEIAGRDVLLAAESTLLLGEDFLPWMVLAFGAAMVVGNALALLRPPAGTGPAETDADAPEGASTRTVSPRPPLGRAAVMIGVGAVAALWGAASLVS